MRALILVDIQNDFMPGGALGVHEGDQIVPIVNKLLEHFDCIVATQDFHPGDHGSFAANHPGRNIGDIAQLGGFDQVLWPAHCVQGTLGAELVSNLDVSKIRKIFVKGTDVDIDSYSGFFDNGRKKATGLGNYLLDLGVEHVYIVGLATDYCVKFTAMDAVSLGFKTFLIQDACRGVDLQPGDVSGAIEDMVTAGVTIIQSKDVLVTS